MAQRARLGKKAPAKKAPVEKAAAKKPAETKAVKKEEDKIKGVLMALSSVTGVERFLQVDVTLQ